MWVSIIYFIAEDAFRYFCKFTNLILLISEWYQSRLYSNAILRWIDGLEAGEGNASFRTGVIQGGEYIYIFIVVQFHIS